MKQIVIISGKGGTGKTTVSAALADLAAKEKNLVLADADVDAANLEILLNPRLISKAIFASGQKAMIDARKCIACGRCDEICRFEAIQFHENSYSINPQLCEGCLACLHQCPVNAITTQTCQTGEWYQSETDYGPFFHARLEPGEENSGKLVAEIIEKARVAASEIQADILLVDGPPGTGCPVTAACRSADLAIVVSEPTVSGKHDLERILQVTHHFKIPTWLVLNKANLSEKLRQEMLSFASENTDGVLGEIPYDEDVSESLFQMKPLTQLNNNPLCPALTQIWDTIKLRIINK